MRASPLPSPSALPRLVWTLGFVSLFMDVSSEIVHGLLPVFLTTTLGASVATVGLVDGASEAAASVAKLWSGALSDRIGRRKPLILFGYGAAALTKPVFALATGPLMVFAARLADRLAKGVRGAPRDALIADATPEASRGRAFGLRQALDTVGAIAGPLAAVGLMAAFDGDIRAVFAFAVVPGVLSAALVAFGVRDAPARPTSPARRTLFAGWRRLDAAFWAAIAVAATLTLARFSESFLILRANGQGLAVAQSPLVLAAMNVVYAAAAYPAGAAADRARPLVLVAVSVAALLAADACLAFGGGVAATFAGAGLWGLGLALTQGLFGRLVAAAAPADLRATAFGVFYATTGVCVFAASVVAGFAWSAAGPGAAFGASAALGLGALAVAFRCRRLLPRAFG